MEQNIKNYQPNLSNDWIKVVLENDYQAGEHEWKRLRLKQIIELLDAVKQGR